MAIASESYNQAKKTVFDAVCKKGKKCGEICIPKDNTCRTGGSGLKTPSINNPGISTPITGLTTTALTLGVGAITGGTAIAVASKIKKEYVLEIPVEGY